MIKSAEQWVLESNSHLMSVDYSDIRAVQADALRHAAELCSRRNTSDLAMAVQRALGAAEDAIKSEAAKLEEGK